MNVSTPLSLICLATLCACGGGGSSSDDVSFTQLLDRGSAFETNLSITPDFLLPVGTTARYEGVAIAAAQVPGGGPDDIITALGDVRATADFNAGTISGTADTFYQIDDINAAVFDGDRISGEVDFDLAQAQSGTNFYVGETDGSLTTLDGDRINFDAPAIGGFFGNDAQQINIEAGTEEAAILIIAE